MKRRLGIWAVPLLTIGIAMAHGARPIIHTARSEGRLRHERRTMTLRLRGPADRVFPLFGPVR